MQWIEKIKRAPVWLKHRYAPNGLILAYHRVAEDDEQATDAFRLSVSPRLFSEQMQIICEYARPVPLREMVAWIRRGKRPDRMVAVTFDDGYADNFHTARPLLERYGVPATIFVASGQINNKREFWWDELERRLLLPSTLPRVLRLTINNTLHQWQTGAARHYTAQDFNRHRGWSFYDTNDPTPRHTLYRELNVRLRDVPNGARIVALDELATQLAATTTARPAWRAMTEAEVSASAQSPLIEIGAHTVTHPVLARLDLHEQQMEIERSCQQLTEMSNRAVTSFAYPHGWSAAYTSQTVGLIKAARLECACTTQLGAVKRNAKMYELPRLVIGYPPIIQGAWNGAAFARFVRWFVLG